MSHSSDQRHASARCGIEAAYTALVRDHALAYVKRGWAVLPLIPGTKHPATKHGWHDASDDEKILRRWSWCGGVAIACAPSSLLALDIDPRHGGDDALHALARTLGQLPQTPESLTGGGGQHLLFRLPGCDVRGQLAPGVEIKTRGYIVAPPTLHAETRRRYEWSVDAHPDDVALAELPPQWLDAIRHRSQRTGRRPAPQGGSDLDLLCSIPSAEYVPALTVGEVNRFGFARCPFHRGGQERTPSLHVESDSPKWYCHACRDGGGLLQFYARVHQQQVPRNERDFSVFVRNVASDLDRRAAP